MAQYVTYDKNNNVLFTDFSNLILTANIIEHSIAEIKAASEKLPRKVYLLTCFQDTKVSTEVQENWGKSVQEILQYVKGLVRYGANDLLINVTIRSSTVLYHTQGNNSYLYPTREAALEAIRQLENSHS